MPPSGRRASRTARDGGEPARARPPPWRRRCRRRRRPRRCREPKCAEARRARATSRAAARSSDARCRRHGEIDVGHHALVQQQVIGRQALARARRRRSTTSRSLARRRRRASRVTPRTTRTLRAHLAQQRQALGEVGREHEIRQMRQRAQPVAARRGVEDRLDACRRRCRICAASSHSSGPVPASTMRPSGTRPEALSSVCAAPAVITPGSVQPGIGNGRSSAPVARMTRRACEHARACRRSRRRSRGRGRELQTVAPLTICAPLACASVDQVVRPPSSRRPGLSRSRDRRRGDGAIDLAAGTPGSRRAATVRDRRRAVSAPAARPAGPAPMTDDIVGGFQSVSRVIVRPPACRAASRRACPRAPAPGSPGGCRRRRS